jgi:hypothetical protein
MAAGNRFPEAIKLLRGWLRPLQRAFSIVYKMNNSTLCNDYPKAALDLLDYLIDDSTIVLGALQECLQKISNISPELEVNQKFKKLQRRAAQ